MSGLLRIIELNSLETLGHFVLMWITLWDKTFVSFKRNLDLL